MQWHLVPGSTLSVQQSLQAGDYLQSPSKVCFLVQQADGNLCIYAGADPDHNQGLVWSANTQSLAAGAYFTYMQADGNLCVYAGTPQQRGAFVWGWTTVAPPAAPSYFAELTDHGTLTVYTGTPSAPGTALWGNFGVNVGGRIEHVVVLMLENRGFDTALGFLYTPQDPPEANIPTPPKGTPVFHGLAFEPGQPQTAVVKGTTITRTPGRGVAGANSPGYDPGEEFAHVNTQLFNGGTPGPNPPMTGFLTDFAAVLGAELHPLTDLVQVLETLPNCFAPWDLPNLSRLAKTYGVSDAWFSSVPTQTNANRAFSLCGQSAGEVDNEYLGGTWSKLGIDVFNLPTVFNALSAGGMTDWSIYYNEIYPPAFLTKGCYTELAFPQIDQAACANPRFQPLSAFLAQAQKGSLPRFSYIEPKWGGAVLDQQVYIDGNDYHPPVDITHSEQMLEQLYKALTSNRAAWAKTLFVIMFDEHGGTYDHVPPPAATPPWGTGTKPTTQYNFGFDRYGVRVPNLFMSPFISTSVVLRSPTSVPFDHTSMIASVLDWCGVSRSAVDLGARVLAAPNFWSVLNLPQPRTEDNAFVTIAAPAKGTAVNWGQRFYLQHPSGKYVTTMEWYDLAGYSGWYPTIGTSGQVAFEFRAATVGNGYQAGTTIARGGPYQIRSDEANQTYGAAHNPEWYNSLYVNKAKASAAIWYGCTDVTADLTQGGWIVHGPNSTLQFGDSVSFESVMYPGNFLAVNGGYLYLSKTQDTWALVPAPSGG